MKGSINSSSTPYPEPTGNNWDETFTTFGLGVSVAYGYMAVASSVRVSGYQATEFDPTVDLDLPFVSFYHLSLDPKGPLYEFLGWGESAIQAREELSMMPPSYGAHRTEAVFLCLSCILC